MTSRTPVHALALLAVLAIGALSLAACGGSSDATSSDATDTAMTDTASADGTSSVIGGGTAQCDQATFDAWVKTYGERSDIGGATLAKDKFMCKDGWAVLFPTVGTDSDNGVDATIVVQAEGPIWALMDRAQACGSSAADSEVPESLYKLACETN